MTYVFDLDGTLIDSSARHWLLMECLLKDEGIQTDPDFAAHYMTYKADGHSGMDFLVYELGIEEEKAATIQDRWISHIEDNKLLIHDILYEDALPTINRIDEKILFVTIRKNKKGLEKELIRLGLNKYKTIIVKSGKDKMTALSELENCIIVGDTEVDYQAAREKGCGFYMLNRGFRSENYWNNKGVYSFSTLSSLLDGRLSNGSG